MLEMSTQALSLLLDVETASVLIVDVVKPAQNNGAVFRFAACSLSPRFHFHGSVALFALWQLG